MQRIEELFSEDRKPRKKSKDLALNIFNKRELKAETEPIRRKVKAIDLYSSAPQRHCNVVYMSASEIEEEMRRIRAEIEVRINER